MLGETSLLVATAGLVVIAVALIPILMRALGKLRPDADSADREQAMAQIRAYTVRSAKDGEPAWDGQSRGTAPTDEF